MYKKLKKTYKCAEEKVNTKHNWIYKNIFLRTKWQKKVFKKN